jgi:hypothetical protein
LHVSVHICLIGRCFICSSSFLVFLLDDLHASTLVCSGAAEGEGSLGGISRLTDLCKWPVAHRWWFVSQTEVIICNLPLGCLVWTQGCSNLKNMRCAVLFCVDLTKESLLNTKHAMLCWAECICSLTFWLWENSSSAWVSWQTSQPQCMLFLVYPPQFLLVFSGNGGYNMTCLLC